jgi:hypothetical protein
MWRLSGALGVQEAGDVMQVFRGMNETSINKTEFGGGRYEMTTWAGRLEGIFTTTSVAVCVFGFVGFFILVV